MLKFFKTVSAVVIGNLISCALVFLLMLVAIAALIAAVTPETQESRAAKQSLRDNSVLVLDLDLKINDTPDNRSAGQLIGEAFGGSGDTSVGLHDLTQAVDRAAKDNHITSLLLRGSLQTGDYAGGYPAIAELRRALARFHASGKRIVAHLDSPSLRDYYLATSADVVALHPFSELGIHGLATNNAYLGAALKKYGVGVQTTKVGVYKSAVEPFTSDHMSDADRSQTESLLNSLWTSLTDDIAKARKIPAEDLRRLSDTRGLIPADEAVKLHLADKTAYMDEIIADLRAKNAVDDNTGSFVQINVLDYIRRQPKPVTLENTDDKIVVIYAEGEIVDGTERRSGSFGGGWLATEVRRLRNDDTVKAIVLRVNSPGGSAFASEVARRELQLFRQSGRPVVVSMGSLAASGGYWISAGSDRIFAEKTTITGSIGVFGLMFDVKDLASGFGVKFDGVKTSRYADIETLSRPKSQEELDLLQKFTDRIYDDFIRIVVEGRKLPDEEVRRIAQGRVWSGEAAKKLGLVDELGGLDNALAYTRKQVKLSDKAPVVQIPGRRDPAEALASLFSGDGRREPVARANDPASRVMRITQENLMRIAAFNDRHGVYARLPYLMEMN